MCLKEISVFTAVTSLSLSAHSFYNSWLIITAVITTLFFSLNLFFQNSEMTSDHEVLSNFFNLLKLTLTAAVSSLILLQLTHQCCCHHHSIHILNKLVSTSERERVFTICFTEQSDSIYWTSQHTLSEQALQTAQALSHKMNAQIAQFQRLTALS